MRLPILLSLVRHTQLHQREQEFSLQLRLRITNRVELGLGLRHRMKPGVTCSYIAVHRIRVTLMKVPLMRVPIIRPQRSHLTP